MSTLLKQTTPRPSLSATQKQESKPEQVFLFDKENYMWMIGGVVLLLLGFFLLSGGKSENPNEFNYAELYSFRRITLAPITLILGFAVEAYAIMKKPKAAAGETTEN